MYINASRGEKKAKTQNSTYQIRKKMALETTKCPPYIFNWPKGIPLARVIGGIWDL